LRFFFLLRWSFGAGGTAQGGSIRNIPSILLTRFHLALGLLKTFFLSTVLVTGHYDCGGIRASVQIKDYGQVLDAWLQNIRDVYRLHRVELDAIQNEECRHRRLVELNVLEQCLNLYKTGVVQKRRLVTHADPDSLTYPRIHGLVFDPATGVLKKIPIDFRQEISELSKTYDLFDVADFENSLKEDYVLEKKPKATK
jgi:Carbonic anhydrase